MKDLIMQTLAGYPDANLASEAAREVIAQSIMDDLNANVEGDGETIKMLFNPHVIELLQDVAQELARHGHLEEVESAYYKIVEACKGLNNGVSLLALTEALLALVATAAEQANDLQNSPEVPGDTKTDS